MGEAHEGGRRLFASYGAPAEPFGFVEALGLMALLVEPPVDRGCRWDWLDLGGGREVVGDKGAQGSGVVAGIGDGMINALQGDSRASACGRSPFCPGVG